MFKKNARKALKISNQFIPKCYKLLQYDSSWLMIDPNKLQQENLVALPTVMAVGPTSNSAPYCQFFWAWQNAKIDESEIDTSEMNCLNILTCVYNSRGSILAGRPLFRQKLQWA